MLSIAKVGYIICAVRNKGGYQMSIKINPFIGNPVTAIIFILIATILLFGSEASYINKTKVARVAKKAVSVSGVSSANNNKLIHFTGNLETKDVITDGLISVNAVVLERNIEEYSEVRKKVGERYQTTQRWEDSVKHFTYHDDQRSFDCGKMKKTASNVHIGEFQLSPAAISRLKASNDYSDLPELPYGSNLVSYGTYYYTNSSGSPQLGDLRVSYDYLPSGKTYSIIAKQTGNSLTSYKNKDTEILIVKEGSMSKQKLLESYATDNIIQTNIVRLINFFLIWFALNCIVSFMSFISSVTNKHLSSIGNCDYKETFLVAAMYFSGIIALAWFGTNILVSILCLIIIGLAYMYLQKK